MKMIFGSWVACACLLATALLAGAEGPQATFSLDQFGAVDTPARASATFQEASKAILAAGGGLLLIPSNAPVGWLPRNTTQHEWRQPAPPTQAKRWGSGPGLTVVDQRGGTLTILPPQSTGLSIGRVLDLPAGESLAAGESVPMVHLTDVVMRERAPSNAPAASALKIDTYSHNENQTFDMMLWRHTYSQGGANLVEARCSYMANANGALYGATTESLVDTFRGVVKEWNAVTGELTYQEGVNAHTLASGRSLINLNPAKCLAGNDAYVTLPAGAILGWGGSVCSTNPAWTADVVGRYFTVDEPDEYVPGGDHVRRWFLITEMRRGTNGIAALNIQRHWWGAKNGQSIGPLYNQKHYTEKLINARYLRYIIAPGANSFDVSKGVEIKGAAGHEQRIRLVPTRFAGTAVDFAAGDRVEQAIGPDPFKPIPFRSWLWDMVPGLYPAPVFDLCNTGVTRSSALSVSGGSGRASRDRRERIGLALPWDLYFFLRATCGKGLVFEGDTEHAALYFGQPNLEAGAASVLKWMVPETRRSRTLGVKDTGTFVIGGGGATDVSGQSLALSGGLSGRRNEAGNLRGVRVPVVAGARSADVRFTQPEPDGTYSIVVQPGWFTEWAVGGATVTGFRVEFDTPAPDGAVMNWMLVR